jgi:IPT/TIG domain
MAFKEINVPRGVAAIRSRLEVLRASLKQRFDPVEAEEAAVLEAVDKRIEEAGQGEPVVTSLEPATAVIGAPDVVLHVCGVAFTSETVILFNGGEEETVYVSSTEVTTIVKPSLASGPITVPVSVVGAADELPFSFTEAV